LRTNEAVKPVKKPLSTKRKPAATRADADKLTPSVAETTLAAVLASLEDSKAEEIIAINIEGKSALADRIVIASGRSHRHVAACAEHLIQALKDNGFGVARIEGMPSADWVLIDQGDIIVHLFRPEVRAFYNIEKMWAMPDEDEAALVQAGTVH
jgi:ribosome-associated protein